MTCYRGFEGWKFLSFSLKINEIDQIKCPWRGFEPATEMVNCMFKSITDSPPEQ